MKLVKLDKLIGTPRDVACPRGGFKSRRYLIEADGMGFTLTRTSVPAGQGPQHWHYTRHLEACYCESGGGKLTDLATGKTHFIVPGTMYALDKHDDHTFEAIEDTVLICVFLPALQGDEVHGADNSY